MTPSTKPTKKDLEAIAERLDLEGRSSMTKPELADAIAGHANATDDDRAAAAAAADDSSGSSSSSGSGSGPASDDEVRARDRARVRTSESNVVDVPARGTGLDREAPRAAKRAVYADGNNRRRILSAGDVIPAGWAEVEEASLAGRTAEAPGRSSIYADVEDKARRGPRGR